MSDWLIPILSIIGTVLASSGFWAYMSSKEDKKHDRSQLDEDRTQLLVGLAHDRILELCKKYIDQGYISVEEFENLNDYLYKPYAACGGNGTAKNAIEKVRQLPIK